MVHVLARSSNEALYEAGVPWLPVFAFNGRYTEIGPLIVPPDSGCFECFLLRRQSNVSYSAEVFDSVEKAGTKGALDYAPLDYASAATAAFIAHQWLAVRQPEMPGISYLERAGSWEREIHHLLRVPRCPVCSMASERGIPAAWWSAP
jgi:bacteriocin biosynthesis cyclodehydratase domain-containing protein